MKICQSPDKFSKFPVGNRKNLCIVLILHNSAAQAARIQEICADPGILGLHPQGSVRVR